MNLHDVMMMGGKLRHKELGIRNKKAVRFKSGVILRIPLFPNLLCRHLFLLLEKHHNISLVFFVLGFWRYGEDFPPKIILWSFRLCIHCVTTIAAASTNYQTIFLQIEKNSFIAFTVSHSHSSHPWSRRLGTIRNSEILRNVTKHSFLDEKTEKNYLAIQTK